MHNLYQVTEVNGPLGMRSMLLDYEELCDWLSEGHEGKFELDILAPDDYNEDDDVHLEEARFVVGV